MSFFKPSHTKSSDADSSRSANSPFVGVQAKLNIGKSNDKYEKEADAVADKVVNKDGIFGNQPFLNPSPSVQRSDEQELQKSEETEQIQEKPIAESITPLVQRKEDEEVQQKAQEEEVQMMADEELQQKEEEEVQAKEEEEVQKQSEEESIQKQPEENDIQQKLIPERDTGEASVQRKGTETSNVSDVSPIQRKDDEIQEKEEEIQEKEGEEEIQRSSSVDTGDTSNLENSLRSSKGGGSPMDESTRSQMESGFGADFSGVRIHNDSNAVQMNKDLGAQAFANGNDIYFNEGKYDPSSKDGQHLLAHELTHTVQQGASPQANVQKAAEAAQPEDAAPTKPTTPLDISHRLNLTDAWSKYLDDQYASGNRKFEVDVKIGERYSGTIELSKKSGTAEGELAKYEITKGTKKNFLKINGWGFLQPLRDAGIDPVLVLNKFGDEQQTTGFLSVAVKGIAVGNAKGFIDSLNENLDKMGFLGIEPIKITDGFENKFEQGRLIFQVGAMTTVVDGFLEAGGGLGITGDTFTFNVNAKVDVAGLASGELMLARGESGKLSGKLDIEADIANVNAKLMVEYIEGAVTIQGSGKIQSEKFSGEITLLVTDKVKSKQMMNAALGVETMDSEKDKAGTAAAEPVPKTKSNQVLAGWGEVTANITPWLAGTAKVGIDSEGHVTIVGEITVPDDIELMEQRGKKVDLFKVEIRAGYGIPLVGQVFLFASIGMFMNAGFGPLVLKNVGFKGTYSTDPSVLQQFEITGTLNLNAFAIIGLEAEAGVGVTILGHDIKAGVNVTAAAGLRAYAEATPTLEYKEQQSPQGGKVGESRLKGHFEAAAQLFLQLSGSLFYELDSPWWSPAPDGREDFPLGEVQYPIGDSMGIGADMDWLIGSPEIPELKFSPVEFDPDKFTADVMADPPPGKKGKSDEKKPGQWEDKNKPSSEQKDPPEKKDGKGVEGSDKKKEDLKKLPDQQKYMRSLDEMSKLEKADPKPTLEVVKAKAQKVKSKYGIDSISVKDKKDQAEISVKHKKDNNKNNILKVPLMSAAERYKLLKKAMDDLKVRNKKAGGENGTITQADAQKLIADWKKAHPVVEEVRVVDGEKTWDYFIDIGDKQNTEKGNRKQESADSGDKDLKAGDGEVGEVVRFTADGEDHKIWIKVSGKAVEVMVASTPSPVISKLKEWKAQLDTLSDAKQKKAKPLITSAIADYKEAKAKSQEMQKLLDNAGKPDEIEVADAKIEAAEQKLKETMSGLFAIFGKTDSTEKLYLEMKVKVDSTAHAQSKGDIHLDMEGIFNSLKELKKTNSYAGFRSYSGLVEELSKDGKTVKPVLEKPISTNRPFSAYVKSKFDAAAEKAFKKKEAESGEAISSDEKEKTKKLKITELEGGKTSKNVKAKNKLGDMYFDKKKESEVNSALDGLFAEEGEHEKYKVTQADVQYDVANGSFIVKYKYLVQVGDQPPVERNFKVALQQKATESGGNITIHTVKGSNIGIKEPGTRGVTKSASAKDGQKALQDAAANDSANREAALNNSTDEAQVDYNGQDSDTNIKFNAAHLLADWFMGSGYRHALNLVTASEHYNKVTMFNKEKEIATRMLGLQEGYRNTGAASFITFDMIVRAEWMAISDKAAIDSIHTSLAKAEAASSESQKQTILKKLHEDLSKDVDPKFVKKVIYAIQKMDLRDDDGNVMKTLNPNIIEEIGQDTNLRGVLKDQK